MLDSFLHGFWLDCWLGSEAAVMDHSDSQHLGGRRGRVPSDSLRKFLQKVNLYNLFNIFSFSDSQHLLQ